MEIVLTLLGVIAVAGAGAAVYFNRRKRPLPSESPAAPKTALRVEAAEPIKPIEVAIGEEASRRGTDESGEKGFSKKLQGTRANLFGKIGKYFGLAPGKHLTDQEWDEIEEVLLTGDVGLPSTQKLMAMVRERSENNGSHPLRQLFAEASIELLDRPNHGELIERPEIKPLVISIVGVNGVGKTTTTGKLAAHYRKQNKAVLLAAADTFRAGAISQLKIWSERTGAEFVTGREGADPGAVAFDSVTAAKARGIDIVLLDTAGRMHTKGNLMDELKKVHRVVKKVIPEAPHERWLVVDGTLGQNSVRQAKEFHEALELTGIVITKLDGTAKGGVIFSLVSELGLPIRFVGLGEAAEDLMPFAVKPFVDAIIGSDL